MEIFLLYFSIHVRLIICIILTQGVQRIYEDLPDLCIDVPEAYELTEKLARALNTAGVLPNALLNDLPQRSDILCQYMTSLQDAAAFFSQLKLLVLHYRSLKSCMCIFES